MAIGDNRIQPSIGGPRKEGEPQGGGRAGLIGETRIGQPSGVDHRPQSSKNEESRPGLLSTAIAYGVIAVREFEKRRQPAPTPPYHGADPERVRASQARAQARANEIQARRLTSVYGNTQLSEVGKTDDVARERSSIAATVPPIYWEEEARLRHNEAKEEAAIIEEERAKIIRARHELDAYKQKVRSGKAISSSTWDLEMFPNPEPESVIGAAVEGVKGRTLSIFTQSESGRSDDFVVIEPDGILVKNPSEKRPDRKIRWDELGRYELDVPSVGYLDGVNQALGERKQKQIYPLGLGRLRIIDPAQRGQVEVEVNMRNPVSFRDKIREVSERYATSKRQLPFILGVPEVADYIPVPRVQQAPPVETTLYEHPPANIPPIEGATAPTHSVRRP